MPRLSRVDYKFLLDKTSGQGFSKAVQCGKRTNLKKYLDDKWREAVREKAGNICERCGRTHGLEAHHVIGRRHMATRHLLENGILLCKNCHYNVAHQNSGLFDQWAVGKRGQEWFDRLQMLKNTTKKDL